jgi:hypothetical protein
MNGKTPARGVLRTWTYVSGCQKSATSTSLHPFLLVLVKRMLDFVYQYFVLKWGNLFQNFGQLKHIRKLIKNRDSQSP